MEVQAFKDLSSKIENVLSKQIFFVIGAQKSGTTWLQKILDAHPEVMCSGEGHFIDKMGVSIVKLRDDYNSFMNLVGRRVYENDPYYEPINAEETEYLILAVTSFMLSKRPISNLVKCIGDKTPANALHLHSLKRLFPNAKFINILRDGRDVTLSLLKHVERVLRNEGKEGAIQDLWGKRLEEYVEKWAHYVKSAKEFEKQFPESCHTMRYEELHAEPENTIKGIFDFLGVDSSEGKITSCAEKASFKKLSGGREVGEEDPNSFVRKGIVGDWKNGLNEEHIALFNKHGLELNKALGYE